MDALAGPEAEPASADADRLTALPPYATLPTHSPNPTLTAPARSA